MSLDIIQWKIFENVFRKMNQPFLAWLDRLKLLRYSYQTSYDKYYILYSMDFPFLGE